MINKLTKVARYAVAAALIFTMVMSPLASHAAPVGTIGGTLVIEPGSSLPVPDVAIASDGRSLVVYHDGLSILGSIVSADGVTVGQPFSISNGMLVEEYGGAPSVIWNEDQSEWLVVFTSDRSGYRHVYAQRVSTSGELAGHMVILPKDNATAFSSRSGTVHAIGDPSNLASQATATWSSEHQVYLVTWRLSASASLLGPLGLGDSNAGLFGYFMTPGLLSADGIDAAFVLQDQQGSAWQALVKQEYSPELDQWAFIWRYHSLPVTRMTTLTFEGLTEDGPGSFVVHPSAEVVNPLAGSLNYHESMLAGDIVWVNSLNAWVVSWGARPTASDPFNGFARKIEPNGTLGAPVQVSNFGATGSGGTLSMIHNQDLVYDSSAGVIYAAAHLQYSSPSSAVAALWSFDAGDLSPIEWKEFISPRTSEAGDLSMDISYRPKISGSNGKVAFVYQNYPTGVSSQVRFHLIAPANTPPVFTSGTTGSGVSGTSSTVYQAVVSDAENDALTYSIDPAVTGFSISATGAVTMLDSVAAGSYVLAVRVDDGTDYETSLVTITVAAASLPVSSPSPTPAPPLAYSGPVIFSGQSAAAGAEVTLTGEKLETVTSAMVGDVPVKIVSALAQSLTLEIPTSLAAGTHDLVLQSSYGKLTVMDGLKVVAAVVTESPVTVPADTAALVKKLSVGSFRGRIVIYSKGHEGSRLSVKVAGKWLVVPELSETWNNTDYSRTTRLVGGGRLLRLDLFIDGRFVRTQEVLTK